MISSKDLNATAASDISTIASLSLVGEKIRMKEMRTDTKRSHQDEGKSCMSHITRSTNNRIFMHLFILIHGVFFLFLCFASLVASLRVGFVDFSHIGYLTEEGSQSNRSSGVGSYKSSQSSYSGRVMGPLASAKARERRSRSAGPAATPLKTSMLVGTKSSKNLLLSQGR